MYRDQIWVKRAQAFLKATLEANRDAVAESLAMHEPGCPSYDFAWDLVELCDQSVEEFLNAWLSW